MAQSTESVRFWAKVDKSGECWLWTANLNDSGYGNFWANGRLMKAHRFAWTLAYGPIPDGLHVLHRCDNPACVRVEHLWLGTNDDNVRDMLRKRRHAFHKTTACSKGHPWTPENIRMRTDRNGAPYRACRTCHRAYMRERAIRKRAARCAA